MSSPAESILDRARRRIWQFERTICMAPSSILDQKIISEYTYLLNLKQAWPPVIIDDLRYGYTLGIKPQTWQMLVYYESRFNPPARRDDLHTTMLVRTRMLGSNPFYFDYEEMHAIATSASMEDICPNPALKAIETYLDEVAICEGRQPAFKAKVGLDLALTGPAPAVE